MSTTALTKINFYSHVETTNILFVYFGAEWCGPCRRFAPIFEEASDRHPEVVFAKVDTEAEEQLAAAFQVRAIPTLLVFRDGIIVFSHAGMLPPQALDEIVKEVKALDMEEVKKKVAAQATEAPSEQEFSSED